MSIVATLSRLLGREEQAPVFDPQRYWESRHRACCGSLSAMGHRSLTDEQNAAQYETKRGHLAEFLRRHAGEPSGRSLLDAGCGVGVLTSSYVELGFDVVGVDFSAGAVNEARKNCPAASFHVKPLCELRLDRKFDAVVAVDVLLHVIDDWAWRGSIAALATHLRSDGVLIILDHFAADPADLTSHCRPRPLGRYRFVLAEQGLQIMDHQQFELVHEGSTKDIIAARFLGEL